jgi:hypothetical protein
VAHYAVRFLTHNGAADPHPSPRHAAAAIAVAAVGVIVVLALLKKPVSYRGFVVMLLVAAVAAYILYNPGAVANTV